MRKPQVTGFRFDILSSAGIALRLHRAHAANVFSETARGDDDHCSKARAGAASHSSPIQLRAVKITRGYQWQR